MHHIQYNDDRKRNFLKNGQKAPRVKIQNGGKGK